MHGFIPLPRSFADGDAESVARALLGQVLVRVSRGQVRAGRIVETEAYLGPHDLACHSSKGRTPRTEVMFGPPGHAYVFLVYGMHLCFNVVTGHGAAVLIRALEPLSEFGRTDGPGRLTKALGVLKSDDTHPLDQVPLFLAEGKAVPRRHVAVGPRIGVDYAKEWARAELRFFDLRSEWVSAGGRNGRGAGS